MSDKVVYLKFNNDNLSHDGEYLLSCGHCRNKCFTVVCQGADFPLLQCPACGSHIGKFGWADEPEAKAPEV